MGAIQLEKNHHKNHHENHHEKTSHQKVTIKKSNSTFVMIFMKIFMMIFFQLNLAPDLSRSNHAFNLSGIFSASYSIGKNSYHSHILAPCIVSGNKLLNGFQLQEGKELKSCNGMYRLKMGTDGELKLYKLYCSSCTSSTVIWNSRNYGEGPDIFFLKHCSTILRQASNPVCGLHMIEVVRALCC